MAEGPSETLLTAIRNLHASDSAEERDIDDYLFERKPRKRVRLSDDELKKQLEEDFLKPSYTFNTAWLNKLQS